MSRLPAAVDRLCTRGPALHGYIRAVLIAAGLHARTIKATALPFIGACCSRDIPPSECWAILHSDIVVGSHAYDDGLTFIGGRT